MTEKELFGTSPSYEAQPEIKKEDFVLVQADTKIRDKKLETKPTTFFKDAIKRFAKNKSSVVGAIIIGILCTLAIIVPFVSSKNIDKVSKPEAFLEPKLFNSGFGFWDGTRKYERIVYDVDNEVPANYKKNAVVKITVDENATLIEQASKFGHNGYIMFENENVASKEAVDFYSNLVSFDSAMNYVYTFEFGSEDDVTGKKLGEYQISIASVKETEAEPNDEGAGIKWRRVGETEWNYLDKALIEVRVGENYIEWRYLNDQSAKAWKPTNVLVNDLLDENGNTKETGILSDKASDVSVIVSYDQEANIIKYRFSDNEFEEFEVLNDKDEDDPDAEAEVFHPNLGAIEVQCLDRREMIQWRFASNGGSKAWFDYVSYGELDDDSGSNFLHHVVLKPFGRETGVITVNVSEKMAEANVTNLSDVRLCIELKGDSTRQYVLLKSIKLEANPNADVSDKEEQFALVKDITTFSDATQVVLRGSKESDYWYCTGRKGVHQSELYYCDFVYDTYLAVYDTYQKVMSKEELDDNVKKGLMTYQYDKASKTLTVDVLSDECPIESIVEGTLGSKGSTFWVTCNVRTYLDMGYKSMPRFLFGTNASGNDMFKKAFSGLRTSLVLGVCTAAFCFIFGLIWGSISGYFGGNVDLFMERFCDILSGVPWIVIMTLCILHLGNNFITFFLALCMTGWMGTAGRTRTQFYRFKGREYVLASRTLGSSDMRLIFRHILPNSLGTIITGSVLMIPSVIFSEATLAYLNLGLQGVQSFGVMMAENQKYLEKAPHLVVFPAVIIALMMISFNLFGNGLRDALNPSLKGSD